MPFGEDIITHKTKTKMKDKIIEILKLYQDPAEDLNHYERGNALFSHLYETVAEEILEQLGECYVPVKSESLEDFKEQEFSHDTYEGKYAEIHTKENGVHTIFYAIKLPIPLKEEPKDSAEEEFIAWQFFAYKSEKDYEEGNYYFRKIFDDHAEMKMFSARHSAYDKKLYPNYCSTYEKVTRPTKS
jgi:hypothetical protein